MEMMRSMTKSKKRGALALGILLVLYILVAFLIPFHKTAVFWLAFVFTLAAFAVVGLSVYVAFERDPAVKSRFYGFPIARIGVIYFLFQLVAGLIFMALGTIAPWWLAVLIFAIALGAAALGLIATDAVVDEIQAQDEKLKTNVSLMRSLQSKLGQLSALCADADAAGAVERFAGELRYSDPVSGEASADVERDLSAAVDELSAAVTDGDSTAVIQLCRKASALLAERNRLCKLGK